MRFDDASKVQDVCWRMRQIETQRSGNREIIQRQFNGDPPFDERTAEENGVRINRNFLKGVQVLADARRQWNQAFLSTPRYFGIGLDSGPVQKRDAWASTITKKVNRYLKNCRPMMEQSRGTGANIMLHGIAPVTWKDRRNPVPVTLPIESVLIPTQTDLDFDNLPYFAIGRELTPHQLSALIQKDKNPGWNKPLAKALLKRKLTEENKDLSAYAELSPEKLEEVLKQNAGFYDSDAVPTIDVLDFYFREGDDGEGWFRRMVLDWDSETIANSQSRPGRGWGNKDDGTSPDYHFLYDSGTRPYCKHLNEVLHCQFGDCSAYAPFKYHSVRSLGWLLWGVCDLMNRMECRFYESVFENLMWFFRASGENDLNRLKKAVFNHLGVIPNGIAFIPAGERFVPNPTLIEQARGALRAQIAETASSYTHDFEGGERSGRKELTATETMARVNSVNALVSGMMTLAYDYEEYKYREICRRISHEDHPESVRIRRECHFDGVPEEFLDSERWIVQAERQIGAGNKTVEMAAVQFLQTIRANLPPQAQRKVDNISIRSVTDQPDLADDLAPMDEAERVTNSTHDAELAAERIFHGLPFTLRDDMVAEDYVLVWLKDLGLTVEKAMATKSANADVVLGCQNMAQYIGQFLQQMGQSAQERPKVKQYADALGQIMNHVKAMAQQVAEQQQAQGQGQDPEALAKAKAAELQAKVKAENDRESHSQKTAQRQVQFEMDQKQREQEFIQKQAQRQREFEQEMAMEREKIALELQAEERRLEQELRAKELQAEAQAEAIRNKPAPETNNE